MSSLLDAIRELYYAAHWTPDRPVDADRLWAAVRDAAGFTPGNAPKIVERDTRSTETGEIMSDLVDRTKEAVGILNRHSSYAASIAGVKLHQAVKRHEEERTAMLDALRELSEAVKPTREGKRDGGTFGRLSMADDNARAILATVEGEQ